jgi:hypothetical protein
MSIEHLARPSAGLTTVGALDRAFPLIEGTHSYLIGEETRTEGWAARRLNNEIVWSILIASRTKTSKPGLSTLAGFSFVCLRVLSG